MNEDWLAAEPGALLDYQGREARVRSSAAYDVEVLGGEPGDRRAVTFVWFEHRRRMRAVLVDHDHYGGDLDDTISLSELEPLPSAPWGVLTGRLGGEEWAAADVEGVGEVEADCARIELRRAGGPDAGGCPMRGWLVDAFPQPPDRDEGWWWVLVDDRQVPRLAFYARQA